MTETIRVSAGGDYDVLVGSGILDGIGGRVAALSPYRTVAVVTDENVDKLYADRVAASLESAGLLTRRLAVAPGEGSKSVETLARVLNFFTEIGLTRTDAVLYVGGGVVGDLAGFAAAVYLRGVDYIAVPTTLLAMLDSSVGGKTGINLSAGKNLAGAFWQPRLVLIDVDTLATLRAEDVCCGIGEAVKYAMIADPTMLNLLDGRRAGDGMRELIVKGLTVKRDAVEKDPFDRGVRQTLNFGHTLGHVVEKSSGYEIPHGVAVGIGMVKLTRRAEELGWTEPGTADAIEAVLRRYSMPTDYPAAAETLLKDARNDKKRKGGKLTLVLLKRPGECYLKDVEADD